MFIDFILLIFLVSIAIALVLLIFTINIKHKKQKKGCGYIFIISFIGILLICTILLIIGSIAVLFRDSDVVFDSNLKDDNVYNPEIKAYSDFEILNLEGHPIIYDNFEEAKKFYENIGNNRVKVVTVQEYSALKRELKSIFDDEVLLYFEQDSSLENFIGTVHINLFKPDLCVNMNLDKAISIIVSYLPENFLTYYKIDSSYQFSNNNITVYTYSCRLNEQGIEYHNNGHKEYSYFYNFKIIYYGDTNQWSIKTDYAAYGDKGLEWIRKYTTPWNVDLSKYIK